MKMTAGNFFSLCTHVDMINVASAEISAIGIYTYMYIRQNREMERLAVTV